MIMKTNLLVLLSIIVLVQVVLTNKMRSKTKVRSKNKVKSSFEKESNKGKYRVETGDSTQENSQLADLLSKVLTSKDDKDI